VVVNGVRAKRRDTFSKRFASRFANGLRRRMLGDGANDAGCGLRLFPRALFLELPYFDHMHRFLPALFIRAGAEPVETPINHRPRTRGRSHYGVISRGLVGIVDLLGVFWLLRRASRPVIEIEDKT
jgi:dolichol-phosphate mannosyltransferase